MGGSLARELLLRRQVRMGLALAVLGVPGLTMTFHALRNELSLASILLGYLALCVTASAAGGWVAGAVAVALAHFFFTEPFFQWVIDDPQVIASLIVFSFVTASVALLTDAAAHLVRDARRALAEAAGLADLTSTLMKRDHPVEQLLFNLRSCFGQDSVSLLERASTGWREIASFGDRPPTARHDGDDVMPIPGGAAELVMSGPRVAQPDRRLLRGYAAHLGLALALDARR